MENRYGKGVFNEDTGEYEYNAEPGAMHTGYFWMSYEDTSLEYAMALAFDPADSMDGYEIYQYDFMPTNRILDLISDEKATMANVFTASSPGRLDAVSCLSAAPGTSARYEVYLLNEQDLTDEETGETRLDPLNGTSFSWI